MTDAQNEPRSDRPSATDGTGSADGDTGSGDDGASTGTPRRRRRRRRRKKGEADGASSTNGGAPASQRSGKPRGRNSGRRGSDRSGRRGGGSAPPEDDPKRAQALARQALETIRELAHVLAKQRGVSRRDAGEALGWLTAVVAVDCDGSPKAPVGAEDLERFLRDLDGQVDERLRAHVAFRLGHVYDFLNDTPDGIHTHPSDRDQTFAGYSPTGRPEWKSFTNLCLALAVDKVDRLYGDRPEVLALMQTGAELTVGLLPGFGGDSLAYNVLGQVVAGLVPITLDPRDRESPRAALTIQLVETRSGKDTRRLRVNLLGLTRNEILDAAASGAARGPAERVRRVVRSTQHKLDVLGRKVARIERRGEAPELDGPIRSLLGSLRGDVERIFRPVHRRTKHAQDRHVGGERPTSDAMRDAQSAADENVLLDNEKGTVIVLGRRGRAHVFTTTGRHVTSLRLESGELERKLERRRWGRAEPGLVATFRAALSP